MSSWERMVPTQPTLCTTNVGECFMCRKTDCFEENVSSDSRLYSSSYFAEAIIGHNLVSTDDIEENVMDITVPSIENFHLQVT